MILHQLTHDQVSSSFTPATMARAVDYATDGSVSMPELRRLEPDLVEAVAFVQGSGAASYVVHLEIEDVGDGLVVESRCNCPVSYQCKHGAAVALVLGRTFGRPGRPGCATDTDTDIATWAHDLDVLLGDLDELAPAPPDLPGVALAVTFEPSPYRRYTYDPGPRVRLRPLRPGSRQAWVKSGLDWSDVASALARRTFDVPQLTALRDLTECLKARNPYGVVPADPAIDDFGPEVVGLLRRALAAGVTLLPTPPLTDVDLLDGALELVVDATSDEQGTSLTTGLAHDGRLWRGEQVLLWGGPAHSAGLLDGHHLTVAALATRLPAGPARAVRSGEPVQIPAAESVPDHLHRLMRLVPVTSHDDSVVLPEPLVPTLELRVDWASSQSATLTWHWHYGDTPVPGTAHHPLRDASAERALLDRLPQRPDLATRTVTGVDVLHLALLELPTWRACVDVDVVETDAPLFREAEAGPEISFVAAGPDPGRPVEPGATTDWLDLEVEITVEGERVPLPDVLAALTLGQEHLILPSGLFVRTDRPELAGLQDVVRAAAELRERRGDRVRVGAADLGLWAQLADLGSSTPRPPSGSVGRRRCATSRSCRDRSRPASRRPCVATSATASTGWPSCGSTGSAGSSPTTWAWARRSRCSPWWPTPGPRPRLPSSSWRPRASCRRGSPRPLATRRGCGCGRSPPPGLAAGGACGRRPPEPTSSSPATPCCAWSPTTTPPRPGPGSCSTRRTSSRTTSPRRTPRPARSRRPSGWRSPGPRSRTASSSCGRCSPSSPPASTRTHVPSPSTSSDRSRSSATTPR